MIITQKKNDIDLTMPLEENPTFQKILEDNFQFGKPSFSVFT
mgnify:CR=1 FL=1